MTLTELENKALKLPLSEKWELVQSLLKSIEQETQLVVSENEKDVTIKTLDSWTKSLIGVIQPDDYLSRESYINYLEEKYR